MWKNQQTKKIEKTTMTVIGLNHKCFKFLLKRLKNAVHSTIRKQGENTVFALDLCMKYNNKHLQQFKTQKLIYEIRIDG